MMPRYNLIDYIIYLNVYQPTKSSVMDFKASKPLFHCSNLLSIVITFSLDCFHVTLNTNWINSFVQ